MNIFSQKIGDFGLSKEIKDNNENALPKSNVGSPAFMAPEIFERLEYSEASDVYAFSILLYEITTFDIIYEGLNANNLPPKVIKSLRPVFNVKTKTKQKKKKKKKKKKK